MYEQNVKCGSAPHAALPHLGFGQQPTSEGHLHFGHLAQKVERGNHGILGRYRCRTCFLSAPCVGPPFSNS